jgi:hypothetical protein
MLRKINVAWQCFSTVVVAVVRYSAPAAGEGENRTIGHRRIGKRRMEE